MLWSGIHLPSLPVVTKRSILNLTAFGSGLYQPVYRDLVFSGKMHAKYLHRRWQKHNNYCNQIFCYKYPTTDDVLVGCPCRSLHDPLSHCSELLDEDLRKRLVLSVWNKDPATQWVLRSSLPLALSDWSNCLYSHVEFLGSMSFGLMHIHAKWKVSNTLISDD